MNVLGCQAVKADQEALGDHYRLRDAQMSVLRGHVADGPNKKDFDEVDKSCFVECFNKSILSGV